MTNQSSLKQLRYRLVLVLRDRLSELEDDEARQAAWEATNWDQLQDVLCPRCGKPALRFKDGLCYPCVADLWIVADRKERTRQRFLRFAKAHNARVDKRNKRGPAKAGPPRDHG